MKGTKRYDDDDDDDDEVLIRKNWKKKEMGKQFACKAVR